MLVGQGLRQWNVAYRYLAPEIILEDGTAAYTSTCDQSIDVFAFAVIFWEVASRKIAFDNLAQQTAHARSITPIDGIPFSILAMEVKNGRRPSFSTVAFQLYQHSAAFRKLIESCWDTEPNKRPSFDSILVSTRLTLCSVSCVADPFSARQACPFWSELFRLLHLDPT
jgi:hypothetical protein